MNPAATLPLRDIHLPPPIPWWPPALGWWLLTGTVLLLVVLLSLWLRRLWKNRGSRRAARRAVGTLFEDSRRTGDRHRLVRELSILLRRIALSHHSRNEVAGRVGTEWLELLDQPLAGTRYAKGFTQGPGVVLGSGPYRRDPEPDMQKLEALCLAWIARLPGGHER